MAEVHWTVSKGMLYVKVWYAPCEGRFFIQSLTHIVRFLLLLRLFAIITAITTPQAPAYIESAIYYYSYTSYYYSVINYYYSYCSNKLHSVYMGYIEQHVACNSVASNMLHSVWWALQSVAAMFQYQIYWRQ